MFGGGAAVETEEGEEDEGLVWGGKGGFKWEDVEGVKVVWGASALGGKEPKEEEEGAGLREVQDFLWGI